MTRPLAPIMVSLLGALVGTAVGACFDAPRPAVQFSCDPVDAPECPPDYTCQADGCCHLDGTDFTEHEGECQIAGALPTGTAGPPATDTDASGSSTGGASTTDATSATSDGSTSGSGSSTSAESSSTGGLGPR